MYRTGCWRLGLVVVLFVTGCSYTTRDIAPQIPPNAESSVIYAADGSVITVLHAEENREEIPLSQIPKHVQDAVVAIEDERFWEHKGVDLRAVLRALRTNTETGAVEQGGSTITQQLVKNTLLEADQTLERKIQEASLAFQLERNYTKERILELYLNTIYFGNGAYGVQAAAKEYFDRPVGELTVSQAAVLAGLIRAPNAGDPFDHPDVALSRRNQVLDGMLDAGFLTGEAYLVAVAEPLQVAPPVEAADRYPAAHFVEEVKQFILDDPRFGATPAERRTLLFTGGLRINTTIDLALQAEAEAAVATVLPDPASNPEAALVALEPATGYVRAMVGGRDFFGGGAQAKFNVAVGGQGRQTGSAFKPFVLAAALERGISLTTAFPAPPNLQLTCADGEPWNVDNYGEGGSETPVDLVEGTVRSYNTLYAQLILQVGVEESLSRAAAMGITTPLRPFCSAVLGTNEVRPIDMAAAYATFANRGLHVPPVMVTRITRTDGTVVYENVHTQERAIDTAVSDQVTAILRQVIERGTGTAAQIGRPAAGKTGTAQAWRDAWFCGYTPQLAAAVWVGFPQEQISMTPPTTPITVTGGSYPARIWQYFMSRAMAPLPVVDFAAPPVPPPTTTTTTAPAPPTTQPAAGIPVPSVVGFPVEVAQASLANPGFGVRLVESGSPGGGGGGGGGPGGGGGNRPLVVVAQSPQAGTLAARGTLVTLEVRRPTA